ncbi:cupredoxin domain-containing protein [Paludibacterium denitrificans]|uniref:cupredoxin domain-containing protein n=1 Tax=Paludibacterium denitrificans TaxID=2675226 RepID=UPI001E2B3B1E|nr:cupredoxin domain-containing protein [Paludibacterium denitrificans]
MKTWTFLLATLLSCSATAADDMPTFRLDMKDGKLTLTRITVPALKEVSPGGGELRPNASTEFESTPLRKEKVLGPGAQSALVFQPLSAGEYKFFDEFHQVTGRA